MVRRAPAQGAIESPVVVVVVVGLLAVVNLELDWFERRSGRQR